MVRKKI